jgi:predicted AlkP superfamily pyrophosphatase or phosphodiesterase
MDQTVILATIDGLRVAALDEVYCPNLNQLRREGAYSLQTESVMPSITLPCFMSIFHSVPPDRHGIVTNDFTPMARPIPGLVDVARAQAKRCAFFYNWEPLRDISLPRSLSLSYFQDNLHDGPDCDRAILEQALHHMGKGHWDFVFIYMGSLDVVGHKYGFTTPEYSQQLQLLDATVGFLLSALPSDSHLILGSDHGGHARTHGTNSPEDMTVPLFLLGPQIRKGYQLNSAINLLDIGPTIARLLSIVPHPDWEGHCIDEAFLQEVQEP